MLLGIDSSHHTGPRDRRGLADTGIKFVFIKASDGTSFRDPLLDQPWQGVYDAGVPCGAFRFARIERRHSNDEE